MPRLDTSDSDVQEIFGIVGYDPDNPGATGCIDVCRECFFDLVNDGMSENAGGPDHPLYSDGPPWLTYKCARCGNELTDEDD